VVEEEEHKPTKERKKERSKVCVPPYPCPSIFLKKFVSVFGKWHHHFETLPLK
jgi:hypothetical protein